MQPETPEDSHDVMRGLADRTQTRVAAGGLSRPPIDESRINPPHGLSRQPIQGCLALVSPRLNASIRAVLAPLVTEVRFVASRVEFVAAVESPWPELLLIDTDLVGCPGELCATIRSVRLDARVVGVSCFWSDREESLRGCLDLVLHKPPRFVEWNAALSKLFDHDPRKANDRIEHS